MELHDREPLRENDTLARHIRLAEVLEGKRSLDWLDLETFIYDSHCLTPQGKQVAVWSITTLKAFLKGKFFVKAQHAPEILTPHPFFTFDFLPGANDVPRVYATLFRLALQLDVLQSLDRFRGMLNETSTNLESVRWYHTLLQLEVASLGQKEGWQVQLELPYNNGTNNKSDVVLSKDGMRIEVDAVSTGMSERGQKKQTYSNWLTYMSIQHGINIVGRLGEPWAGTREEEQQWIQKALESLTSVARSGLRVTIYSPKGGNLTLERASYGKTGMPNIHDEDRNENVWDRIRAPLSRKNEKASGNLIWIRMREHAGLWHWSQYRTMTLEEKLNTLSPMTQATLESLPNIAGVLLSPGILPVYHPEEEISTKYSSADGSFALRCSLPGHCARESIIVPRRGRDADALELAALYEQEDTWLDWALQQAGKPPFHTLTTEL